MYKTKGIRTIIFLHWFLLLYIIAALVWWFISLQQQNNKMTELRLSELQANDASYQQKLNKIYEDKKRKTAQYIGEGITFLALIIVGAVFVYRATKKQLKLSHQQQNFMMAVTHELKTPIAVTRLNLETLQKRKLEEAQQQKLIAITLQEVNRLNDLCNNILLASQLDAGKYQFHKSEVNLSALSEKVIGDFTTRYPSRKIISGIEQGITLSGEELLLELVLSNLLENALKYSPKDAPVEVRLVRHNHAVELAVRDEEPGIPENEREKVFEKFYRIGNETTRTTKGTGLGLYLCKQIAKDHNAHIKIESNHPAGSVFRVTFNA